MSHVVRHVVGSCCGGCDLTKAVFWPTNPWMAVWTIAQPSRFVLHDPPPLSLSCMCTHTHPPSLPLALTHTFHAPCSVIAGIFHSAEGEHCSQLCCQLPYVNLKRVFVGFLQFFFLLFLTSVTACVHTVSWTRFVHVSQQLSFRSISCKMAQHDSVFNQNSGAEE